MQTMLEPRAARIEEIRATLDDTRFATEAIAAALDAYEAWIAAGWPVIMKDAVAARDALSMTHREFFRAHIPAQYLRCRNVKLLVAVFDTLAAPPTTPMRQRPFSIRQ